MTEPGPVLDQRELDRLTKAVGRAMVRAAGEHWRRIRAEYRSVGRHIEVDVLITGRDGVPRAVRPPAEVVEGLGRLRAGMYRPGRGTWLGAAYEIEPPGTFSAEFEPDQEPVWRRLPPPIGFQDELRTFPRSEEFIPDWFRVRAGMPPAVPPETQDAGTPPRGIERPGASGHGSGQSVPGQADQGQVRSGQAGPGQPGPGHGGAPTPGQGTPQQPVPSGGRHAAPPPPWENPPPGNGPGRHAAGPYRPPQGDPRAYPNAPRNDPRHG
ncbi:hypothetical protein [Actinokineospora enzanensis]|uniref:hypothetical protein n=1 Tax=Actinokineospora enzanensis TaxID=155975 RepID=UPI00037CBFAE|nr:hypothetical protein [Actinokineospora enzanensis]